jgi:acyl-CoA thioester hydrolase
MPAQASVRIPVRWRDLDLLGHLNQAVYHEYLEEGRAALMDSLGEGNRFPFVLARVELDYRAEIRRRHGEVEVVARVERVGSKSLTVSHDVLLPDGTVAASGTSVFVAWDVEARGSRPLTDAERAALEA